MGMSQDLDVINRNYRLCAYKNEQQFNTQEFNLTINQINENLVSFFNAIEELAQSLRSLTSQIRQHAERNQRQIRQRRLINNNYSIGNSLGSDPQSTSHQHQNILQIQTLSHDFEDFQLRIHQFADEILSRERRIENLSNERFRASNEIMQQISVTLNRLEEIVTKKQQKKEGMWTKITTFFTNGFGNIYEWAAYTL